MLVAAVGIASLTFIVAPAAANVSHVFSTTFGSATSTPPDPYPISGPTDVAVDQASHDIYVTDPGHYWIEKFAATGDFILMFGKEVNKTAVETAGRGSEANVCPAPGHASDVCQSGVSGRNPGRIRSPHVPCNCRISPLAKATSTSATPATMSFPSSTQAGEIISSWGVDGQKDGCSDDEHLPKFGALFGIAVGGGCETPTAPKVGTCHPNGTLFVGGRRYGDNVRQYTQSGEWIGDTFAAPGWVKVSAGGNVYFAEGPFGEQAKIFKTVLKPGTPGEGNQYQVATDWPTVGFSLDPSTEELYQAVETRNDQEEPHGIRIDHYSTDCEPI